MLITDHRFTEHQIRPARQSGTGQDPADRTGGHTKALCDPRLSQKAPPQLDNRQCRTWRYGARTHLRPGRRVAQAGLALRQVAAYPLTHRRHANEASQLGNEQPFVESQLKPERLREARKLSRVALDLR